MVVADRVRPHYAQGPMPRLPLMYPTPRSAQVFEEEGAALCLMLLGVRAWGTCRPESGGLIRFELGYVCLQILSLNY